MADETDRQRRYRAWVTVGPSELPFSAAIRIQKVLNRLHPELSAIGCGSAPEGQMYSVSCETTTPAEAREVVGMAFGKCIAESGLGDEVEVVQIQLERIW